MLEGNPEFFNIEELKKYQVWPLPFLPAYGMIPYLKRLGNDLIGIEIGVLKGENAFVLLEELPNIKMLTGIDPYLPYQDLDKFRTEKEMRAYKNILLDNLGTNERFTLVQEKFRDDAKNWNNESVDFILIDHDQTEENIKLALDLFYPKLKVKGMIFGHDDYLPHVKKAVREWRDANKVRIPLNYSKNQLWFWTKLHA